MKKKLLIVLVVILIAAVLSVGLYFIFKDKLPDNENGVSFSLVLRDSEGGDTVYQFTTEKSTLFDALIEQKEKETFDLDYTGGDDSPYLTKIGSLDSTSFEQGWLAVYTSIEDAAYSNSSWGVVVYQGKTLNSCALGAKMMPIYDRVIYLIELKETW